VKDNFLPLQADILGPFDETGQISSRLNVLADAEIARAGFKKGIFGNLRLTTGGSRCGSGSFRGFGFRLETQHWDHGDEGGNEAETNAHERKKGIKERQKMSQNSLNPCNTVTTRRKTSEL